MKSVVVESILWEGRLGGAVFSATTADGTRHRIVAASRVMPRAPVPGEVWDIDGVICQNPAHGPEVRARSAVLRKPSGQLIVRAIARSPSFPGLGTVRAKALWEAFGEDLYALLALGSPEPFEAVLGPARGPALALVFVQGWLKLEAETEAYRWLDTHGLPVWLAVKLLAIYGADLVAKLEENPYRLLAFTSWTQADRLARAMGVARDDQRRLVAAAEAACLRRLSLAHTWTSFGQFLSIVSGLLGHDDNLALKAAKLAQEAHAIVRVAEGVQGLGPCAMERFVAARVKAMLTGDFQSEQLTIRQEPTSELLDRIFDAFAARTGLTLNSAQKEAVRLAVTTPLVCVTGGAGVGKTTLLKAVNLAAESLCFTGIHQMALSGMAAKRITQATGRPASTIASFLVGIDSGRISLDGESLLIIDEASMLDLVTCYRIMRRMPPGTRLLLVGDAGQLAPIGFGLTFHFFVEHTDIPSVELTEIHRAAAISGIPQGSVAIRSGRLPNLHQYTGRADGISFIDADPDMIADCLIRAVNDLGGVDSCQMISAIRRRGASCVHTINGLFQELLTTGRDQMHGFAKGEPVIWGENDYPRELLNGSRGRVVCAKKRLKVDFDGIVHDLDATDVRKMALAYAITVHKSQGSEFGRVVIPVFPSRILDRTLIYTACTRGKKQVVLIGDRAVFQKAVKDPPLSSLRQTGMAYHLEGLLK